MEKDNIIMIIVTLVFSIPIWLTFVDNIFARIIGFFWGVFGWFLVISYWDEVKLLRQKVKK